MTLNMNTNTLWCHKDLSFLFQYWVGYKEGGELEL